MKNTINNKDNVVVEASAINTNESAKNQSTQQTFCETPKFARPEFSNPFVSTKYGRFLHDAAKGFVKFYDNLFKSMFRLVNWLVNTAVKLAIIGTFLIAVSWYCQQNPEFAAWMNEFTEAIVVGAKSAYQLLMNVFNFGGIFG